MGRVRLARHRASGTHFALKAMAKADVVRLQQVGPICVQMTKSEDSHYLKAG